MAKSEFYRVNNSPVPSGPSKFENFHPQRCPGSIDQPLSNRKDGIGRPIAEPGFPFTVWRWTDLISIPCYQHWRRLIGWGETSLILNDLCFPDPNSETSVEGYEYHSEFNSGIMWQIQLLGGEEAYQATLERGERWIRGGAVVRITELGGGPFY